MIRAVLGLLIVLAAGWAEAADVHVISQIQGDTASEQGMVVVREAYRRVGIEVRAELLPNERGTVSADTGDTDGDTMRMAGLEAKYPNLVRVPEPVMLFNLVAFTAGLKFDVEGWESLRPYTLCIVRGFKLGEMRSQGMNRELPASSEAAFRMLRAGHCQVAPMGEAFWLMIDELKLGPLRALNQPVEVTPLYHYVNKRHAHLVPKLAEALKAMRRDGTIDSIMAADRAAIHSARERNSVRD
ncbi:hypothetical protein CCC_03822 [Paramagnetospirillum magnetotacticum MS-1]|uniref:Solute-binding protein family 3/N-terminal domain-containing protein n=1 Tax=Paramagnetospirillum magnetotacticum MS-1 TaxID=272627 RepID=A0A0C2YYC2_PARME|nr:hypothetical protein [Paramagnetospirillum magnetotacticum]KIL99650.1 hypothetical protein CCC_03822 [Paramagnetospirillum magnetotacticum MS-1]